MATIAMADRCPLYHPVRRQIGFGQHAGIASGASNGGDDITADRTGVEPIGAVVGDHAHCIGEGLVGDDGSGFQRLAAGKEISGRRSIGAQAIAAPALQQPFETGRKLQAARQPQLQGTPGILS